MTVTELAILVLNPGATLPSPELSPHFALLASRQSEWSGHPLRFYTQGQKIILLSGWMDVPAHYAWIASEGNQELLKLLTPHLNIELMVHLDVPFERVPDFEELVLDEVNDTNIGTQDIIGSDVEGKDARRWSIADAASVKEQDGPKVVWKKVHT
ncbi:unnamed protein product [Peniophora sp. CBMAI 1063]|nr:unnamed protein product [Peniophora sp. CBMAI 1063]